MSNYCHKNFQHFGYLFLVFILSLFALSNAWSVGALNSSADVHTSSDRMYSIEAIYQRLSTGESGTLSATFSGPTSLPGQNTSYDLNDVMSVAPEVDTLNAATPEDVMAGKRFWGLKEGQWGYHIGTWTPPEHYAVRVKISGLTGNNPLVLDLNTTESLTIPGDTETAFSTHLVEGSTYDVSITALPAGRVCNLSNTQGLIAQQDVLVEVVCHWDAVLSLLVNVQDLLGSLVLKNGTELLNIDSNGQASFTEKHAPGFAYSVTVAAQPADQVCSVNNSTGTFADTDVTNVAVLCSNLADFNLKATVSGLNPGSILLLKNNNDPAQSISVNSNGEITFPVLHALDFQYQVQIVSQPLGQICSVRNGQGIFGQADVTNVEVICADNPIYHLSVTVAGLNGTLKLTNTDGEDLTVYNDGQVMFNNLNATGFAYNVSITDNPTGQQCSVSNGAGVFASSDIDSISVNCVNLATLSLGGSVSGLNGSLTLQNNGADDITVSADGSFQFATLHEPLTVQADGLIHFNEHHAPGVAYNVTVVNQPADQICSVAHASGVFLATDINTVSVQCINASVYQLKATISGLNAGNFFTLVNVNDPTQTVSTSSDGEVVFPAQFAAGTHYQIQVDSQPAGQKCNISNASGVFAHADVNNVTVLCADNAIYHLRATVTGLQGTMKLINSDGEILTVSNDGQVSFVNLNASGFIYNVSVMEHPTGQQCSTGNDVGMFATSDIDNVVVHCRNLSIYTLGGSLSGLSAGSVVLEETNGDTITLTADGNFQFPTLRAADNSYQVTITSQPAEQSCSVVAQASGRFGFANITNMAVQCVNSPVYLLKATVSGLNAGNLMTLVNNRDPSQTVTTDVNGEVTFPSRFAVDFTYEVQIDTQPLGQSCSVTNATGIFTHADVSNVTVQCVIDARYHLSATVNGLNGTLKLINADGEILSVTADGVATFNNLNANGFIYNVSVMEHPAGQHCSLSNDVGIFASSDINNISVSCQNLVIYSLGGTVTGLEGSLMLNNNLGDTLTLTTNGQFQFATLHQLGDSYHVTAVSPTDQACTVSSASGSFTSAASINTIDVHCVNTAVHDLKATVSGLGAGKSLVLNNNSDSAQSTTVNANGMVTLPTQHAAGFHYNVQVTTQPVGQVCNVATGSGIFPHADVDISVSCADDLRYHLRTTISGLNGHLMLKNSDGETLTVDTNGVESFSHLNAIGFRYQVTVSHQPTGQTCTVTNGMGIFTAADISNVNVHCSDDAIYSLGGSVTGMSAGSLVLQDNHGHNLSISSNGTFQFPTLHARGFAYTVTVQHAPTGQTCHANHNTGTFSNASVSNVSVICTTIPVPHQLIPSISGLGASKTVVLANNSSEHLTVSSNGAHAFAASHTDGFNYNVTVATQPAGQDCVASHTSGTFSGSDVTSVSVTCTDVAPSTYTVGGSLSGYTHSGPGDYLTLQNKGGDDYEPSGSGPIEFPTSMPDSSSYNVTVSDSSQTCTVKNGTGTINGSNITNVKVNCKSKAPPSATYTAIVCSGWACFGSPTPTTCGSGEYPMVSVIDTSAGGHEVTKSCSSWSDCYAKWWRQTSDLRNCKPSHYGGDNGTPSYRDVTCHYCCTGDNCNQSLPPPESSFLDMK